MKKLLSLLIIAAFVANCAKGQRKDAGKQLELAPSENYCLRSDMNGEFQVVNCNTLDRIEIEIGTGTPASTPTGDDPRVYLDDATGFLYGWDGTQWVLSGAVAQNGLTKTGNVIELGGTLIKNTKIEDPTDTYDFEIEKGNLSINIEASDHEGTKSANLTGVASNGNYAIIKAREGRADVTVTDGLQSTLLNMTPTLSTFSRQDNIGSTTGVFQSGSLIEVRSNLNTSGAGLFVTNPINVNLFATNGTEFTKIQVSDNEISFLSPNVRTSSAQVGDVWTLIDPTTGVSDFKTDNKIIKVCGVPAGPVPAGNQIAIDTCSATNDVYVAEGNTYEITGMQPCPTGSIYIGANCVDTTGLFGGNVANLNDTIRVHFGVVDTFLFMTQNIDWDNDGDLDTAFVSYCPGCTTTTPSFQSFTPTVVLTDPSDVAQSRSEICAYANTNNYPEGCLITVADYVVRKESNGTCTVLEKPIQDISPSLLTDETIIGTGQAGDSLRLKNYDFWAIVRYIPSTQTWELLDDGDHSPSFDVMGVTSSPTGNGFVLNYSNPENLEIATISLDEDETLLSFGLSGKASMGLTQTNVNIRSEGWAVRATNADDVNFITTTNGPAVIPENLSITFQNQRLEVRHDNMYHSGVSVAGKLSGYYNQSMVLLGGNTDRMLRYIASGINADGSNIEIIQPSTGTKITGGALGVNQVLIQKNGGWYPSNSALSNIGSSANFWILGRFNNN